MEPNQFIRKIRRYSLFSFLLPLIAINLCLFIYTLLGKVDTFPNGNDYSKKIIQHTLERYIQLNTDMENRTFTNCPKTKIKTYVHTDDSQKLLLRDLDLLNFIKNNKVKYLTIEQDGGTTEEVCIKNYYAGYVLLKNFSSLEKILIKAKTEEKSGFAKIKSPYLYGEVSISRTARYYPATFIFKPLVILSAFFLFLYWKNNLNLYRELKNKNILGNFTEKFFYFGLFSCIFLTFHALFLGLDIESKLFSQIRRLIIILFIVFEVIAQILLTKNLFTFKNELKEYISPLILKIKVLFVVIVFITTLVAFSILTFANPTTGFKHILEWNYFSFLLLYYLLSRLLWVGQKNQKF